MGARPYDPALGRLYAVDPIEGGSLYEYAGQDPINASDLDGTCSSETAHSWSWGSGPEGGAGFLGDGVADAATIAEVKGRHMLIDSYAQLFDAVPTAA